VEKEAVAGADRGHTNHSPFLQPVVESEDNTGTG